MSLKVVGCFQGIHGRIDSAVYELPSNAVLDVVRPCLEELGFEVESGKSFKQKINVPVLFGPNGRYEKSFNADAWHREEHYVLEVEAGRAVVNNQFLKDLLQASVMAEVDHLAIACRNLYKRADDFSYIVNFLETIFVSGRVRFPMSTILIIGY
jgi:hypothetical protein